MADDKLIMAMDMPNAIEALKMAEHLGDAVNFYKIGLGMLTGGGLALANELKAEMGKRIFLDMKLFDIGATVEHAVRGIAQFDLDFLTVHGDPYVVRAAKEGAAGKDMKILAVTILTSLDRADLDDALIKPGDISDLVLERAGKAFDAGADGVIASPQEAAIIRALPEATGKLIVTPGVRPTGSRLGRSKARRHSGAGHCQWCRSCGRGSANLDRPFPTRRSAGYFGRTGQPTSPKPEL
jgi:orotidine-5'-phosphate decarboxylase